MKKFKPTKKWAREQLKAVNKLIEEYQAVEDRTEKPMRASNECSLCVTSAEIALQHRAEDVCSYCPWLVFKKGNCVINKYEDDTVQKRLYRLYGWRTRLLNIINKK